MTVSSGVKTRGSVTTRRARVGRMSDRRDKRRSVCLEGVAAYRRPGHGAVIAEGIWLDGIQEDFRQFGCGSLGATPVAHGRS